jgi:hypothetical protein
MLTFMAIPGKTIRLFVSSTVLCLTSSLFGGQILQNGFNSTWAINFHEPIGQSFTAEDPNVTFGFYLTTMNPTESNGMLTVTLYQGSGFGGSVLGSSTFGLADGYSNFFDVDFSAVNLAPGNVYTVGVSTTSSLYWGLQGMMDTDNYAGGTAFTFGNPGGTLGASTLRDWRFRVTPAASEIPEPAGFALLPLGLAALAAWRRFVNSTPG